MSSQLTTELTQTGVAESTLTLVGTVDISTQHLIWNVEADTNLLEKLAATHIKVLIIDLSQVARIDSLGLRMLLSIQKEATERDIKVILKNPNSHLSRLFKIMQFDKLFAIEFDEHDQGDN